MKNNQLKRYETDLYRPIEHFFNEQGYTVHGEVNDCDLTASKDNLLIIVELKLSLNIELLIQATKRQRLTELVYVAIPKPTYSMRSRKWKDVCHLLRRLELGLITVAFHEEENHVAIVFEPGPFDKNRSMQRSKKKRTALLAEIAGRRENHNVGGSHQTKIMTAYKENCIHIACCLEHFGPLSPKLLREMGTGDKTASILTKNYNGWFERIKRGTYALTEKGRIEYKDNPKIADFYYKSIVDQ